MKKGNAGIAKLGLLILAVMGAIYLLRGVLLKCLAAAVFCLGTHRNVNTVVSPGGTYILTAYDAYGVLAFQEGTTIFNLRRKDERMSFRGGFYLNKSNDIVVIGGNSYPHRITWLDEQNLRPSQMAA